MTTPSLGKRMVAEFVGTFWLVFAGLGSAIFAAGVPNVGIGYLGVAIAVGLSVLTMAYAIGHISGCHLNPAVSIGLCCGRRFPQRDLLPYIIAQLLGGLAGATMLYVVASGAPAFVGVGDFASNGYGEHSPGHYSLAACFVTEMTLTFMFLWIIMGSTDRRAPQGFAPISIGLGLTLILLVGIPITNLSVNPARSTATAVFTGGWALTQLWLFWAAPIAGAALGGLVYRFLGGEGRESPLSPLEKLTAESEAAATRIEHQQP